MDVATDGVIHSFGVPIVFMALDFSSSGDGRDVNTHIPLVNVSKRIDGMYNFYFKSKLLYKYTNAII